MLGAVVVFLIYARQVRALGAAACVAFGLVLGATPAGPQVSQNLDAVGSWLWTQVQTL